MQDPLIPGLLKLAQGLQASQGGQDQALVNCFQLQGRAWPVGYINVVDGVGLGKNSIEHGLAKQVLGPFQIFGILEDGVNMVECLGPHVVALLRL